MNVNQLGYKAEYEAVTIAGGLLVHSELHKWVRRLMMLAFVPTAEVAAVFGLIIDNIPDSLNFDPFLGYYERTWIAGLNGRPARFQPENWNQTTRVETGLGRTNNFCESFNETFAAVVGHAHPTIFNFVSAVQLEQASTEGKVKCFKKGLPHPKRKKEYVEKDIAIKNMVDSYDSYEDNIFDYLELADL